MISKYFNCKLNVTVFTISNCQIHVNLLKLYLDEEKITRKKSTLIHVDNKLEVHRDACVFLCVCLFKSIINCLFLPPKNIYHCLCVECKWIKHLPLVCWWFQLFSLEHLRNLFGLQLIVINKKKSLCFSDFSSLWFW